MSLKENWHNPAKEARLMMEDAAKSGLASVSSDEEQSEPKVKGYRIRGRIYDKIKVPLKTMDIIIGVIVALIVIAIVVGVIIGK